MQYTFASAMVLLRLMGLILVAVAVEMMIRAFQTLQRSWPAAA